MGIKQPAFKPHELIATSLINQLRMPLILLRTAEPDIKLGLWAIQEEASWFLDRLVLSSEEQAQLTYLKGHKQLEFLAARKLVHLLSELDIRQPLVKDTYGKPYLPHLPHSVSISHSRKYAAALLGPNLLGIDIQHIVPKIEHIAPRFMHPTELAALQHPYRLEQLHVYWCAKEAMYKAYGRRQLELCRHILVHPFQFDPHGGQIFGQIQKDDWSIHFQLTYLLWEDYMLVWALEKDTYLIPAPLQA